MIACWSRRGLAAGLLTASLVMGLVFVLTSPARASEAFGVESFASSIVSDEAGAPATQAGSHPYALTTAIIFNHLVTGEEEGHLRVRTYGDPKDIDVNLPAGVIVNPRATETRCTEEELENGGGPAGCPNGAAVGVFSAYFDGIEAVDEPVYNMAPPTGVPAEFGLDVNGIGLIMHVGAKLRTGADYGLSADISEIPDEHPIYGLELTLWGDPSEASHDEERGLCAGEEAKQIFKETGIRVSCPVERITTPLLTLPSSCTGEPLTTTMSTDSWQEPGAPLVPPGAPDEHLMAQSPAVMGCEKLDFSPKLTVSVAEPAAANAESPSGLDVDLKLPQEEGTSGLAEADLKEAVLTLPAGMAISPSAANGRVACNDTPEPGRPEGQIALHSAEPVSCPEASILGSAKILTPLLEGPLEGSIYLARPYENDPAFGSLEHPDGSLLALYVAVEGDGMLIKLAGKIETDPHTGQLTITFADNPQLPFSEIKMSLFGGERALLVTPPACGAYEVQSSLTPWSGTPIRAESSTLEIDSGPGGGACPSGRFDPSFTGGTENNQAGAFSSFSLTFSRQDGEQRFGAYTVQMPPGLLGILKNVALCPEPQASLGQCPQASAIGTTTVGAGPGEDPFYLPEPGQPANAVYLTGPTPPDGSTLPEGSDRSSAPFGLSIVVPAIAGPFDLGDIVMRARIEVDPHTAQLTILSDPLPTIWEGIPLDIRTVNLSIDRSDFIFNPTDCAPLTVGGTISSAGGMGGVGATNAAVSSPFQAANCAQLPFAPKLTALTEAKTSKQDGAYLHVKVVSGPTHPGQANIGKLKLDLPKQLPARQATLQQACASVVFEADSAACPAASVVGRASVVTPVFGNPLTGPAYLVSHGGAAFPDLEIVLEGEGVELELDGQTSIKHGVTSSTFKALPDAPISSFDLVLQNGPHSLLATNLPAKTKGNLCSQTLSMPTAITGQNGAVIKQSTKIAVFACPQPKRPKPKRVPPKLARG